jgi:hypothetical protein
MTSWLCVVSNEISENISDNSWANSIGPMTVGQEFTVKCSGDATSLDPQLLSLLSTPKYQLQLIQVENLTETEVMFKATSYLVGDHKSPKFKLTDGTNEIELSGFDFSLKTVIESKDPQKPPEPFGPFGPLKMNYPIWLWLAIVFVFALLAIMVFKASKNVIERIKLKKYLDSMKTARSPFEELHFELRALEKKRPTISSQDYMAELEKCFKVYLVRELRVPAETSSLRSVLKEVKKITQTSSRKLSEKNAEVVENAISRPWNEFLRWNRQKESLSSKDLDSLSELVRQSAEKLFQAKRVS